MFGLGDTTEGLPPSYAHPIMRCGKGLLGAKK